MSNLTPRTNTRMTSVRTLSLLAFAVATAAFNVSGQPVTLTRGPYLQLSTPASIVIRWRTDVASGSRVVYGTNLASLVSTNLDPTTVTEHEVLLTNLLADTKYYYAIGTAVTNLAGPSTNHFFLTHPWPGTEKPIRVWVIGDAGTKNANQQAVRDAFYNFNGTNTVHAWLQLGDNAYNSGTDAEYQLAVFDMYSALLRKSVTWPTLGNHEIGAGAPFPYFDIFTLPTAGEAGGVSSGTEHYYSFDLGMAHFISLDSVSVSRAPNGAMARWLQSDLEANTNRWTIAYCHYPPYSKGRYDSDTAPELVEMRENILPILEAGGVDLVLGGHNHSYMRSYLIDGHYGLSGTFDTNSMLIQPGSGREINGVGAYLKSDGLGETPVGHQGAIYAVAGSSGQTSGVIGQHPVMYTWQDALGSVVLDFHSDRLDAVFLRETGATGDWFSIIKEGTHPPVLANPLMQANGDFQFTVLSRAYRTNVIEATESVGPLADWISVATNVPSDASFEFLDTNSAVASGRFYRVRRP